MTRIVLLVAAATLLLSAANALSGSAPAGVQSGNAEDDMGSPPELAGDYGGVAAAPENGATRTVHGFGGGARPAADYPFSDANQYHPVYVFTRSQSVRDLAAEQGLLGMTLEPGPLYAESELGFLAWVPEPLIPVLEQHPEVERLEWAAGKMPLVLIKDPPITDIFTEEELAQRRAQS